MPSVTNIAGNTYVLSLGASESVPLFSLDLSTGEVASSYFDAAGRLAIQTSLAPLLAALSSPVKTSGVLSILLSCVTVSAIDGAVTVASSAVGNVYTLDVSTLAPVSARVTIAHTVQGGFVGGPSQNSAGGGSMGVLRSMYFGTNDTPVDLVVSSGIVTLTTSDIFRDITITGTGALRSSTGRIFANRTLTFNGSVVGAIRNFQDAGGNGSGASGGVAVSSGNATTNYYARTYGTNGGAGGINSGSAGSTLGSATNATYAVGSVISANGGAGGNGAGGFGGTTGITAGILSRNTPFSPIPNPVLSVPLPGSTLVTSQVSGLSGRGGGGGAGSGAIAGGGGGAGGSAGSSLYIGARNVVRVNSPAAPCIQLLGGNGGIGSNALNLDTGGGGGGGGGGAGYCAFVYETIDANTVSPFIEATGGDGGDGGTGGGGSGLDGFGGTGGSMGRIHTLNLATGNGYISGYANLVPASDRFGTPGLSTTLDL
jgi:hypothetical protein